MKATLTFICLCFAVYSSICSKVSAFTIDGPPIEMLADRTENNCWGLDVDETYVYWTEPRNGVFRIPKSGGSATRLTTSANPLFSIVVFGNFLYWAEYDENLGLPTIRMCSTYGGPVTVIRYGSGSIRHLAVDSSGVYWVEKSNVGPNYFGVVYKIGGVSVSNPQMLAGVSPTDLAVDRAGPSGIAIDGNHVYWIEHTYASSGTGSVLRVPKSGGAIFTLVTGLGETSGLVLDQDNAYFGIWNDSVYKVSKTGGTAIELGGHSSSQYLAEHGAFVYSTSIWSDGQIQEIAKDGSAVKSRPTFFESDPARSGSWGVVADASGVYWTECPSCSDPMNGAVRAISAAYPAITSHVPTYPLLINGKQPFTIFGFNFDPDCTVTLRDHRTGEVFPDRTKISQTDTLIELSVNFTAAPAEWSVEVTNQGGISSNRYYFRVGDPVVAGETRLEITPIPDAPVGEYSSSSVTIEGGTDISFEIKLVNDSGENDVTGAADLFASNLDGMNLNNFRLYTDEGLDTAETTISAYYDSSDGRVASDPILVSVLPQLTVTVNYEWLPDRGEHKLSAEVYDPAGLVDESDCSFNWDLGADGVVEYEGFGSVIYPGSVFYDHALSMGTNRILVRAETEENPKRVDYDEITVILESKHSQEPVSQSAYEPSVGDILDDEGFDAVLTSEKADVGLIVLIHGMDDTGESEWIQGLYAEIYEAIDPVPNIVIYDWHEMSDADYVKINLPDGELLEIYDRDEAFGIVDDILEVRKAGLGQGYLLASKIDKLIDSGLVQTDKPIHLIGHSAGGFVAGKVAEELVLMYLSGNLSDPGIQITMLDTPCPLKKHLVEASSFVTPERYISSRFGKARLWLGDDNTYYRKEIPKRYGNGLLFDQIKNHGYAHEWYRETVKRTESLFHSEGDGFQRSLFFGSQALTTQTEENSTIIEPSSATLQTSSNNMTEISGFSKFGDVFTSPPDFTITEEVNAGIYTDYTMPIGAEYLHFSTQYSGKNDGDFLSVHFGDEVVAVIPDVEYRRGSLFKNKINVGHLAGETNTLMFKLVSRGDPGCSLLLSNIGITKTEDPDADGLTILEEESVGSDPLDPDSDNDGLSDGDEVNTYGTDPLKADTDDDGQNDGDEIRAGTDPLAAEDALRITNFEMLPDGSVDLTWSSKSDKTYRVYRTETLDFLNYRAVGGGAIPGEAGTTNLTDTPAVDVKKMFYWIEVEDF